MELTEFGHLGSKHRSSSGISFDFNGADAPRDEDVYSKANESVNPA